MNPTLIAFAMGAAALVTGALIFVMLRGRAGAPVGPKPGGATRAVESGDVRILAEHVVNKVSMHDAEGSFRYVSPRFADLLGMDAVKVIGIHPRDFAHPDDTLALAAMFKRAGERPEATFATTWRCRRGDGEYAWLETTARAAEPELRRLGAIVCASRDITERKQIEDALRESEQRFRAALESVRLVAVGLDTSGRITFANDSLCALTGWTRSELIGENWFDRCVPAGDPVHSLFRRNIAEGRMPPRYEHEIVARDGKRRMIEWDNTVLRTPSGEVQGTASLGADVTERRQEETALKLLQSITLSISAAKDLDAALALTLESLSAATGWQYGEAWLPTADGARMERVTHYVAVGVDASPLVESGADARFAVGDGLPGRAWESRSVVWVPDISDFASERLAERALHCGFRAAVALPLLEAQEIVAVLTFFMDRPRATDVRHTQMVFVVANQVASVIARRLAQKQHEAELLRARDAAQAASHAKSDFLSRMSHELRTPLNSVIGFANVLKKNKAGRLGQDELTYLNRITANGQHLLQLVNDVLDIAKVEAGRLTVTTGIVAVDQLVQDVVGQLEGQPRGASVQLRAELPPEMMPIQTDGVLLRQVLINLLGNALRFTHEGSVVVVAEVKPETLEPVRISVRDTGIGIDPERLEAIFEPFEQADPLTHRSYGGTGLGLSISRAICDALGYPLTVESTVGKGSLFTIHLDAMARRGGLEVVSNSDRSVPNPDTIGRGRGGAREREPQRT